MTLAYLPPWGVPPLDPSGLVTNLWEICATPFLKSTKVCRISSIISSISNIGTYSEYLGTRGHPQLQPRGMQHFGCSCYRNIHTHCRWCPIYHQLYHMETWTYVVERYFSAQPVHQLQSLTLEMERATINERNHCIHHLVPWFLKVFYIIVFLNLPSAPSIEIQAEGTYF